MLLRLVAVDAQREFVRVEAEHCGGREQREPPHAARPPRRVEQRGGAAHAEAHEVDRALHRLPRAREHKNVL